jgi:hypothetical protein
MKESKTIRHKVIYPVLFIKQCKETFPNNEKLHKRLDEGEDVGSILNDTEDFQFYPHMIISNFESVPIEIESLPESIQGLYRRAVIEQDKQNLFGWYLEIVTSS